MVKKITENEFDEVLKEKVAIVDFSATWCGPCKMIAPILEELSNSMEGQVAFYNVDVDENAGLAEKYGIMSVPALVMLKNGKKIDMEVGFKPKAELTKFINNNM